MKKIVLASASPRRQELLEQIGVDFVTIPSNIDEGQIRIKSPTKLARHLALSKAKNVAKRVGNSLVIGADTIVVYEDEVLGKPNSKDEAFTMLSKLSGKEHQVITGLAVIDTNTLNQKVIYEVTEVTMRQFTNQEISDYIATGEPMDKAGAYAIQERGAIFVDKITGSFSNVVGLPLTKLFVICQELGYRLV
ncbi:MULTISPECIES: Maf family protein [unclassified Candidatus Frackibacter]|uniref:Maf family protein n=1 Tax=unclassified Candidatus Frackibacter TaxID=2648818 RepID=UPI00079432A7|nr:MULTISPECIES: Maf family protein [unclassified Candidatus Frackibacter]KXS36683.1 MAG: septum formation protein [Candidatus Frackibacter sp. T328-2]SDC40705.1 septum formation protein [Candidatus Frackibacter sp. WG11]SEM60124.1 septum formation protein [Candidatus Frackibacter sp. WG12]SFL61914.1 septum formation protein [Candidatus Frackibacter sp. WG13]